MNRSDAEPVNPYAAPQTPAAVDELAKASVFAGFARYVVLAALCTVALIAYVQRNSISVAESAMRDEMGLSKHEMSWVISAFFLTYALLQLRTGGIAKMLVTRRALPSFVGLFSAAAAVFSVAGGFATLFATRLCMREIKEKFRLCAGLLTPHTCSTVGLLFRGCDRFRGRGDLTVGSFGGVRRPAPNS